MEEFVSGQTDEIEVTLGTGGDVEFSPDMNLNNRNLLGKNINIGVADHCNELQIANNFSLANIFSWEGEVLLCLYCKKLRNLQDSHLANRNYQGMAFAIVPGDGSPMCQFIHLVKICDKVSKFQQIRFSKTEIET